MKQAADTRTFEPPSVPVRLKPGRKPHGDVAMTPAQRKRASRFNRKQAALKSGNIHVQVPVPLSAEVDMDTRDWLAKAAREKGVPVGVLLDEIVSFYKTRA